LRLDLGDDRRLRSGEQINLTPATNAHAGARYDWTMSGGAELGCADCPQPVLRALTDAVVRLTLTDSTGCAVSDSLSIGVDPATEVYLPTAFSPDGDGVNDRFYAMGTVGELLHLRIFDRWGSVVFEVQNGLVGDSGYGWDGRIRGRPAPAGVYLVVTRVRFPDGREASFLSELNIMR
jgi:gliding motility-associated-like protein